MNRLLKKVVRVVMAVDVILVICSCVSCQHRDPIITAEIAVANARAEWEKELDAAVRQAKIDAILEYEANRSNTDAEADEIARVLYGMRYNTESDLRGVVWVILNRVDDGSPAFGNTVEAVCRQSGQWVGYDESNPIITALYDMALDELTEWRTDGHRPFGKDVMWFDWSASEINFKSKF